jgi:hypothetical protein
MIWPAPLDCVSYKGKIGIDVFHNVNHTSGKTTGRYTSDRFEVKYTARIPFTESIFTDWWRFEDTEEIKDCKSS